MVQIFSHPVDRLAIKAYLCISVFTLVKEDCSKLVISGHRADIDRGELIAGSNDDIFDNEGCTVRVTSFVKTDVELL